MKKHDKDYENQHKEQQPHYIERRATGRDRLIHIPRQYNQQIWRHRRRRQSKDTESKSCVQIWRVKQIKTNTKLRIFNSTVKAVLLYGSETWRSTQKTLKSIQTFINKCLRRILHLKWTDKISNITLWKMTKQLPIENEIKKRKWRWIGHTPRKPPETITWNPPGKR